MVGTTIAGRPRADPYERSLAHTALISDSGGEAYYGLPHTRQPQGHACPALCRVSDGQFACRSSTNVRGGIPWHSPSVFLQS